MARLKRKGLVYVRITRFADSVNELTIGISGAVFKKVVRDAKGLALNNRVYLSLRSIEAMNGVDELDITPRLVVIVKKDAAKWDEIVPTIEKVLGLIFGNRLRISKRNQRCMPERLGDRLGEANLAQMRDAMQGCALTADERKAIYG